MDDLVTPAWLAAHARDRDLRVVDATYLDTATGRDPTAEFEAGHIPGAVFLNLDELRDTNAVHPMMLPGAAKFASRLQALGLGDGVRIVLYDDSPWHTAARAWWMLREYGLTDVAILDGGLARWRAEGRPLETGPAAPRPRHLTLRERPHGVRTLADVDRALRTGDAQVVDARSAARFSGAEGDPRPGVAPGHMPGAVNLPYPRLFQADGTWKRGEALAAAFVDAGVKGGHVIATCGSGITAAVLLFGLHLLGREGALYDGSWSEWGSQPDTAKVVDA